MVERVVSGRNRPDEIYLYNLAKMMIPLFGYRDWMSNNDVIGPNNERIIARFKVASKVAYETSDVIAYDVSDGNFD